MTSSKDSIATSGAYQISYLGNSDAFLAKFGNPDSGINPNIFSIDFYPNPFHSHANLKYNLNANTDVNITLFDAIGRRVAIIADKEQIRGQYSIYIDAAKFPLDPGVYFLVFRSDEGNKTIKIVNL